MFVNQVHGQNGTLEQELVDVKLSNTPLATSSLGASMQRYRSSNCYHSMAGDHSVPSEPIDAIEAESSSKSSRVSPFYVIIVGTAWMLFILLMALALCFGVWLLMLKLSLFSFLISVPISEWTVYRHWFPLILLLNQLWNIVDTDNIRISAIYRFLFIDSSMKHSEYVSQRVAMLDNVVKETLWSSLGSRGFLLALSLNDEVMEML